MGDVDIQKVKNIDPIRIHELTGVEPLRIGQVAPAAVHIKELNHIDPISVDSLRIDQVRNLEPVRVERFDVTYLPTVNVSLSRLPAMDLNIRRVPPLAVALHQELCLPSEYTIHAKLLGIEVMRLEIHGQTMVRPKDRARRERSRAHERSFPDVAAAGNPGIPIRRTVRTETVTRHACSGTARAIGAGGHVHARPALSAGAPLFHYPLSGPPPAAESGAVSSGGLE